MYTVFEKLNTLPVASILTEISEHTLTGGISIVNAITGSGKSLLVPLRIQQERNEVVIVIQPSRYLAINATETLALLSDTKLGEEFGYMIGSRGSEENRFDSKKTKVAFMTYGYALATKLIMEASHIVLDEVHEHSLELSICMALIKHRYATDNAPKSLVLMSASLNAETMTAYWQDVAPVKVFAAGEGRKFECKKVHLPATQPWDAALELINEGKKGVLLFAPGIGEIEEIVEKLRVAMFGQEQFSKVVVESIYGQSEYEDRIRALSRPPEGYAKILVGTNVIESGMNLDWVDSGVTTGEKKELHIRPGSGAIVLVKVPLVKSNVDQRAGRTNRFCDSKFIICGEYGYNDMQSISTPEIERLPLTALYMHCQAIDVDLKDLEFLPQPSTLKLQEAALKLRNLGFFNEKLRFTDDGKFAKDLSVGLETAAMLCHANKLGILQKIIPLAGILEIASLRKNHKYPHDFNSISDVLDGTLAYVKACEIQHNRSYSWKFKADEMERINVSYKRWVEVGQIISLLEKQLGVKSNYEDYIAMQNTVVDSKKYDLHLQCILAASVCRMGFHLLGLRGSAFTPAGLAFGSYVMSNGTAITNFYDRVPATATLRTITSYRDQRQFTVAEHVTLFTLDIVDEFNKIRPGVFTHKVTPFYDRKIIDFKVNGVTYFTKTEEIEVPIKNVVPPETQFKPMFKTNKVYENNEPEEGSFGQLLNAAWKKRVGSSK